MCQSKFWILNHSCTSLSYSTTAILSQMICHQPLSRDDTELDKDNYQLLRTQCVLKKKVIKNTVEWTYDSCLIQFILRNKVA